VKEYYPEIIENPVRLLVDESSEFHEFKVETPAYLYTDEKRIALLNKGNRVLIRSSPENLSLQISDKIFYGSVFELKPAKGESSIHYKGKMLRGGIKVVNSNNAVQVINTINLEEYLKGVLPKEMPLGRGTEYLEALKAVAVCARTYALARMQNNRGNFDLYIDVRDQVYGGENVKSNISDKAVDETKNMILTFNGEPAPVFYHSTCGGRTEDVRNIFTSNSQSYLKGVVDGENPFCSVSPSFNWTEIYPENVFIDRLYEAGLLNSRNYFLTKIEVLSRYESGRVNELLIELSSPDNNKQVRIQGNKIRSIIRTANNKGILKSIWFDIFIINSEVVIKGKGYGHGVGLCQWGALYQSQTGVNYKDILMHYFPGIEISERKIN
jgi:stage II sporulation protein D